MRRLLTAALLVAAATACSSTSDDSSTPDCGTAWRVGATLPADYAGCALPDGSLLAAVSRDCRDGSRLFAFEPDGVHDEAWAFAGGKVHAADDFTAAYDAC